MLERIAKAWLISNSSAQARAGVLFAMIARCTSLVFAAVFAFQIVKPLTRAGAPPALSLDSALDERKAIFADIAKSEESSRKAGTDGFPEDEWSAEDHRCAFERDAVRAIALQRNLSISAVYMILDQGIREQWPDPDGKPLMATTVPLRPRRHVW